MKALLYIGLFFSLCVLATAASAQTGATDTTVHPPVRFEQNVFGIGLHASLVSGLGISFRHRVAGTSFAYQLNGGVLKAGSTTLYDIGGELHYDLSTGSDDRVYAIVGGGYYYKGPGTNDFKTPTRIGAGVGYEFTAARQLGVSLALLVMGFLPGGDILPLPQIGFHYFFK